MGLAFKCVSCLLYDLTDLATGIKKEEREIAGIYLSALPLSSLHLSP